MLKSFIKIFITILSISNIYAQAKFEPGYIVPLSGDTIRGMIEYRNWSQNPESIRFRSEEQKNESTLGINDIAGFEVHGEIYERAEVCRNISPSGISENHLPELAPDTVFLLILADGAKSLYYLRDHSDRVQLYIGSEHELLVYHKYQIIKENQTRIVTIDRYRQQVKAYLNCPEIDNRIPNLRYSNREILRLFELYYKKCSTEKPKAIRKREGLGIETGVIAGATFSKLTFAGYNYEYLINRKHAVSARPTVGLSLNIVIPRTRRNLLVTNELIYSSYKISDHYLTEVNSDNYTITDFTFALNHLRLNNMVRYRITRSKAFFYINAGISNGFIVSEDNRYLAKIHFYTDVNVREHKALETRKHDQGFIVGIGAGIRKLGFEARFENSNGNSDFNTITSTVKRLLLLVHYRF